LQGMP